MFGRVLNTPLELVTGKDEIVFAKKLFRYYKFLTGEIKGESFIYLCFPLPSLMIPRQQGKSMGFNITINVTNVTELSVLLRNPIFEGMEPNRN